MLFNGFRSCICRKNKCGLTFPLLSRGVVSVWWRVLWLHLKSDGLSCRGGSRSRFISSDKSETCVYLCGVLCLALLGWSFFLLCFLLWSVSFKAPSTLFGWVTLLTQWALCRGPKEVFLFFRVDLVCAYLGLIIRPRCPNLLGSGSVVTFFIA